MILRKKLGGHSKWGDFIIRWYRNAKKGGEDRDDLRDEFLTNFDNIKDLLRTYESNIEKLKSLKIENEPIEFEVSGKTLKFHPIKDIQKIRRLEGFELLLCRSLLRFTGLVRVVRRTTNRAGTTLFKGFGKDTGLLI